MLTGTQVDIMVAILIVVVFGGALFMSFMEY